MNLTFREINPDNYQEAYAFNLCHEYSFRDSSSAYVPDSEEERIQKTKRIIETLLSEDPRYFCLAVFDGDQMIAGLFQNRMEIDKVAACHIHGLWVDSAYRKQGIGKKLKERGEFWAKAKGCVFMDSNVRVTNQAMIKLNEDRGYEVARLNFRKKI